MKKLIFIVSLCLLFSCKRSNYIEISEEEYNKLRDLPPKEFLEIGEYDDNSIVVGSDGHQYYSQIVGGYARTYIYIHYVDCKLCIKRNKQK